MKRILALLLGFLLAMPSAISMAELANGQADEYTQAVVAASAGSVGGTVYGQVSGEISDEVLALIEGEALSGGETTFPDSYPKEMVYNISDEELEKILDALIATMTFDEKINMMSMNSDPENRNGVGYMTGIPRLGVPESRLHDGPAGISADVETSNPPNQLLTSMSWSEEMAYLNGMIYGIEHFSIGSGWQLGTQHDLARTPFWARAKDTFGEDYYLTSRLTVAQTKGIQENGAIPMAKHIGAYSTDGDTQLMLVVDEQTLHTAYLYPFEAAAKEANLASIMGTYNRVQVVDKVDPEKEFEGYYVSSNAYIQRYTLRDLWNWEGAMVPDWGANKEFSLPLGTDISQSNAQSVKNDTLLYMSLGLTNMDRVNEAARNALYAYGVAGYLNLVQINEETGLCLTETGRTNPIRMNRNYAEDVAAGLYDITNAYTLEIAEKSIPLLKNENGVLPLSADAFTGEHSVALIGYGAVTAMGGTGGERSKGYVKYFTNPYDSLKEIVGEDANISAYILNDVHGVAIPAEYLFFDEIGEEPGLTRTYGILEDDVPPEGSSGGSGGAPASDPEPVDMEGYRTGSYAATDANIDFFTGNGYKNTEDGQGFVPGEAYTWKGYVKAPETGAYKIIIQSAGGKASVKMNDSTVSVSGAMDWDYYTNDGCKYSAIDVDMEEGKLYEIIVTVNNNTTYYDMPLHLTWITPSMPAAQEAAAEQAAAENDTVIIVTRTGATGHGPVSVTNWDISLSEKEQVAKLARIAKDHGNNVVVIVFSRSGYTFEGGWLENTDALLSVFYPGQSGATAIAEILTGKVNPSGKLSMTLPKVSTDTLLTIDEETKVIRAGAQVQQGDYTAYYTEGLAFGYRWYDEEDIEPQFAFGHGLSYSAFEYGNYSVAPAAAEGEDYGFDVTLTVTNTSDVAGTEIVQVYIGPAANLDGNIQTVEKQLCTFARVEDIQPGEAREVTMHISERMLSYWDSASEIHENSDGTQDKFFVPLGERDIMIGSSSDRILHVETVTVQ